MALIPLYGFVRGDTLGVLVLVHDDDTVATLGASLMQAASVRVTPSARVVVERNGLVLSPERTVAEVGLGALERIDLRVEVGS